MFMQGSYRSWYLLIVLLVVVPAGLRVSKRPGPPPPEVDAVMAEVGRTLFNHVWVPRDPLAHGGDGLGPVFNAQSCAACHHQGGLGGSARLQSNVTLFTVRRTRGSTPREGVVHADAVSALYQENLAQVHPGLPAISRPTLEQLAKLSQEIRDEVYEPYILPRPDSRWK
jgi:hypothetical protein